MSPTLLATLRRVDRDTRRLAAMDPPMPLCDFYAPLDVIHRAHPTVRPRIIAAFLRVPR